MAPQSDTFDAASSSEVKKRPMECLRATEEHRDLWTGFVESHPEANLGHLFDWQGVFGVVYGKQSYYLAAVQSDKWLGVLPLTRMRGPLTGNRLVSLPFLDQAGVLSVSASVHAFLLDESLKLAREIGASGVDLRARAAQTSSATERATLILNLSSSTEELWKSFVPKVRNQVRKSEKSGLVTEVVSAEKLGDFYRVFAWNMRDLGSPVHSLSLFEKLFDELADRARLYLTYDSSRTVIGGAISLSFAGTVTVPWASSLRETFSMCPNHSLYWRILRDVVEGGAGTLDFGRSYLDSGTYRFKQQWGAQPCALDWNSYDSYGNKQQSRELRPNDHETLTRLWSRLPVFLANLIGPLVRRQLPN